MPGTDLGTQSGTWTVHPKPSSLIHLKLRLSASHATLCPELREIWPACFQFLDTYFIGQVLRTVCLMSDRPSEPALEVSEAPSRSEIGNHSSAKDKWTPASSRPKINGLQPVEGMGSSSVYNVMPMGLAGPSEADLRAPARSQAQTCLSGAKMKRSSLLAKMLMGPLVIQSCPKFCLKRKTAAHIYKRPGGCDILDELG